MTDVTISETFSTAADKFINTHPWVYLSETLDHGRATSGPRARSGPRRPSVRPVTLLGNNIAIRPAKPQLVLSSVLSLRAWAFGPVPFVVASRRCRTTFTTPWRPTSRPSLPSPSLLTRAPIQRTRSSWPFSSVGSPLTWMCVRNSSSLSRCDLLRSSVVESRSHAVPFVWPAEGDRHLSSSEESSLHWSVFRLAMARSPSPADGHHYAPSSSSLYWQNPT